ncbi:jg20816 [Pararge aegeria aegeria]|uniref:Jg20816 protein n=1 Tax=Pararge aegeria aegeria TaxID=348720 RepID=A0A8S4R7Q9_9NEOP|nr:jg20816 [Pararge aegeria aegeria]
MWRKIAGKVQLRDSYSQYMDGRYQANGMEASSLSTNGTKLYDCKHLDGTERVLNKQTDMDRCPFFLSSALPVLSG